MTEGWFVTFGFDTDRASKYFIVREEDYGPARKIVEDNFGTEWCQMYPMAGLQEQIDSYGLKELRMT